MRGRSRVLLLAACVAFPSPAQETGVEILHGGVGMAFPSGTTAQKTELAWSLCFGGTYFFGDRFGINAQLEYHNFGLSNRLLGELQAAGDGYGTLSGISICGLWRLHGPGKTGAYLLLGGSAMQRNLTIKQTQATSLPQDEPWTGLRAGETPGESVNTSRAGFCAGLGWETPLSSGSTFFVELRYLRVFTSGKPTEMLPLMLGTRF